jgi:hypothetical protein
MYRNFKHSLRLRLHNSESEIVHCRKGIEGWLKGDLAQYHKTGSNNWTPASQLQPTGRLSAGRHNVRPVSGGGDDDIGLHHH